MGNFRYNPCEKLEDIVVAAEQPFGKGRIIALGDSSTMTNGISTGSHVFTSWLPAWLTDGRQASLPK